MNSLQLRKNMFHTFYHSPDIPASRRGQLASYQPVCQTHLLHRSSAVDDIRPLWVTGLLHSVQDVILTVFPIGVSTLAALTTNRDLFQCQGLYIPELSTYIIYDVIIIIIDLCRSRNLMIREYLFSL